MSEEVSEEALSSWNKYAHIWREYVAADYNLRLVHSLELPALVKRGLHTADAPLAFQMAETLTVEERKILLPDLLSWCSSGKYGRKPFDLILSLPHGWLLENIEFAAEATLQNDDYLDWVNILGLYVDIDLSLAQRLAQRMLTYSDPDIREWGEEFLTDHKEN